MKAKLSNGLLNQVTKVEEDDILCEVQNDKAVVEYRLQLLVQLKKFSSKKATQL